MPNDVSETGFQSVLAPLMEHFIQEKHTCGCAYREPTRLLHRLDEFLVQEGLTTVELPRSVARKWLAKRPHESARTQQQRINLVRHFSRFLLRVDYPAYIPEPALGTRSPGTFVPRMLTDEELQRFFRVLAARLQDLIRPTGYLGCQGQFLGRSANGWQKTQWSSSAASGEGSGAVCGVASEPEPGEALS